MTANRKRITISVTPDIAADLDNAWKENFCQTSQNEMMRALILKGLDVLKTKGQSGCMKHNKSA